MDWKKVIVQAILTLVITGAGLLIMLGRYQQQLDENVHDINDIELRVEKLEDINDTISNNQAANTAAHAAILRELDGIQAQLASLQKSINSKK